MALGLGAAAAFQLIAAFSELVKAWPPSEVEVPAACVALPLGLGSTLSWEV